MADVLIKEENGLSAGESVYVCVRANISSPNTVLPKSRVLFSLCFNKLIWHQL